jgi:hypothetical protein
MCVTCWLLGRGFTSCSLHSKFALLFFPIDLKVLVRGPIYSKLAFKRFLNLLGRLHLDEQECSSFPQLLPVGIMASPPNSDIPFCVESWPQRIPRHTKIPVYWYYLPPKRMQLWVACPKKVIRVWQSFSEWYSHL